MLSAVITSIRRIGIPSQQEQEVADMLHGDVARYRTEDLLRVADARRAANGLVKRQRAARALRVRRLVTTAVALLPIPVKH